MSKRFRYKKLTREIYRQSSLTTKEKKMKKVKLSEIKRPETVEEFQANLKRFYYPFGNDSLYVKPKDGSAFGIKYSDIEHFNDIYRLTESGMQFDWTSPSIIPLVASDIFTYLQNPAEQEVFDTNNSSYDDVVNFGIEKGLNQFPSLDKEFQWVTLDNQIYREIYAQTLGKFSGYEFKESLYKEVA